MSTHKNENEQANGSKGYETLDVSIPFVAKAGILLVALILVGFIAVIALYPALDLVRPAGGQVEQPAMWSDIPVRPPAPLLQSDPSAQYQLFRAEQQAAMNTYGWVSREEGIASIPVERAMDIVLERGLPAWEPVEEPTAEDTQAGAVQPQASHEVSVNE